MSVGYILFGGLGNKLFQAAAIKAYCWEHNKDSVMLYSTRNPHESTDILDTVLRKIKHELNTDQAPYFFNDRAYCRSIGLSDEYITEVENLATPKITSFVSYRDPTEFKDIPVYDIKHYIVGYFQNTRYFDRYRREILELFEAPEEIDKYLEGRYGHNLDHSVALHVRVPDGEDAQPEEELSHYISSIKFFKERCDPVHFYVFSNRKVDLGRYESAAGVGEIFHTPVEESDANSLYLMSKCRLGCINWKSTLSWWGNYLNRSEEKLFLSKIGI